MLQWLRSLAFVVQMYVAMLVLSLIYIPLAVIDRKWAYAGIRAYCGWVRLSARHLVGLHSQIRGAVPAGDVLVCAKHQSFFDILLICSAVQRPRFVMKRQLLAVPVVGFFARRIGCIAIDREKGSLAVRTMLDNVGGDQYGGSQLVIYPQGTRVGPGKYLPYRVGASILYTRLEVDCVPVATNVGVFWPRQAILRRPGVAIVEFLDPVPPGMEQSEFHSCIETIIEGESNRLMREAGFEPDDRQVGPQPPTTGPGEPAR